MLSYGHDGDDAARLRREAGRRREGKRGAGGATHSGAGGAQWGAKASAGKIGRQGKAPGRQAGRGAPGRQAKENARQLKITLAPRLDRAIFRSWGGAGGAAPERRKGGKVNRVKAGIHRTGDAFGWSGTARRGGLRRSGRGWDRGCARFRAPRWPGSTRNALPYCEKWASVLPEMSARIARNGNPYCQPFRQRARIPARPEMRSCIAPGRRDRGGGRVWLRALACGRMGDPKCAPVLRRAGVYWSAPTSALARPGSQPEMRSCIACCGPPGRSVGRCGVSWRSHP
jgi:hypothetical protein